MRTPFTVRSPTRSTKAASAYMSGSKITEPGLAGCALDWEPPTSTGPALTAGDAQFPQVEDVDSTPSCRYLRPRHDPDSD
jgi:hypothetical protein